MASAGELCRRLLAKLKKVEVTSALCADILLLSGSDAAFLALAQGPPAFGEAWPEAQPLDAEGVAAPFLAFAAEALRLDPRLQKRCDRLVPRRTTEANFWRCYASALHVLLLAPPPPAPAAGEGGPGAAAEAAGGAGAGGSGAAGGAETPAAGEGGETSGLQHGLFFQPAKARQCPHLYWPPSPHQEVYKGPHQIYSVSVIFFFALSERVAAWRVRRQRCGGGCRRDLKEGKGERQRALQSSPSPAKTICGGARVSKARNFPAAKARCPPAEARAR
jgi:hypothetical protein